MKLYYVMLNIKRQKVKSLLTAGIGLLLVILIGFYFGSMYSYQSQLRDLAENTSIFCQVTNSDGSRINGLVIPEETVDALQKSEHVKDAAFTAGLTAGIGEFKEEDWAKHMNISILGANRPEAVDGLSAEDIQYADGWEETFFQSEENVCLASADWMERNQYETGDTVELNLFYYVYDDATYSTDIRNLGLECVTIAGTMETGPLGLTDVVFPLGTVRRLLDEKGKAFTCEAASFYVRDPQKLNEFKAEMEGIGLLPQSSGAMTMSFRGNALLVKDGTFISLAGDIRQIIDLLGLFFPMIFAAVLFTGYVVSFLLCSGRKKEVALLRIMGIQRSGVTWMLWLEQGICLLAGVLAGDILAVFLIGEVRIVALLDLMILVSYLLGALTASYRAGKLSVVQLLASE